MYLVQNEFYHIYNRGNNKQPIFFNGSNYIFFIKKIREQLSPYADIVCYCLMPNHFHLIVMANEKTITERNTFGSKPMQEFAYRIGIMLSSYTQAINKQNNTTGSLFQQKTKAKILCDYNGSKKDSYLEDCFFYVHNNPVAAGLVKHIQEWPYSSYPDYVKLRNGNLCKQEMFLQTTGLSVTDITNRTMVEILPGVIKRFY